MGLFLASVGYTAAVAVARLFVNLESHCSQGCPVVKIEGFQVHHFYYGLVLSIASVCVLLLIGLQRVRWDASLFFGVGVGLMADETGLLFLGVSYSSSVSLVLVVVVASVLYLATINAALSYGTLEFRALDRADVLMVVSIMLAMAGTIYFDRPLRLVLEITGGLSWTVALALFALYGKTHFRRILGRG